MQKVQRTFIPNLTPLQLIVNRNVAGGFFFKEQCRGYAMAQSVTILSPCIPTLNSRTMHVVCVVDKAAPGQFFF